MLNAEVRLIESAQEVLLDSVFRPILGEIRGAVRDEVRRASNQSEGEDFGG